MSNDLDRHLACATIPPMSRLVFATAILTVGAAPARAADDPLLRARLLYNQRQFEAAVSAAEQARLTPARADLADLVAARAYLEQFRLSVMSADLTNARDRLRRIDPLRFAPRERVEYVVGLGETLFFDGAFGAAAAVFESVLQSREALTGEARERVLDWWASASDREAKPRSDIDRQGVYQRIRTRMDEEIATHPGSAAAAYWLAARARRAISRLRGMRRRPAGSDRLSRAIAAPRCAPTSICSSSARSSPIERKSPRNRRKRFAPNGSDSRSCGTVNQAFASFQFSPMPMSTVIGTFSTTADCMRSRTISATSSARAFGTSNSSSSWTVRIMRASGCAASAAWTPIMAFFRISAAVP